jgi:hypothetical protein
VIQAPGSARKIARTTVRAPCAKTWTAKCYGGDISCKRKPEKQKEGKKRTKMAIGKRRDPAGGSLPRDPQRSTGHIEKSIQKGIHEKAEGRIGF